MRALAAATLLAALALPGVAEPTAQEVDEDCSLASTLVTPHKDWASELAGGPIRALFFVYTGPYDGTWEDAGSRVREIVELGQRLDLQADAVLFCGSGDKWVFHGLALGEQRAERLLETPYDLYCIAGFPMDKLPARIQYRVMRQVAQGAGLLCVGPGAEEYLAPKRRIDPTPPELLEAVPPIGGQAPAEVTAAYRLGNGRGAWVRWDTRALLPSGEYSPQRAAESDYRMLLLSRAGLWAAGRVPEVSLEIALGDPPPAGAVSTAPRIRLRKRAGAPMAAEVTLELCRARDGARTPLGRVEVTLRSDQTTDVPAPLPPLRTGDYYLDAVVSSERGAEACGAAAFAVTSPCGVEGVTLDRSFVEVGETLRGTVTLRGTPEAGAVLRLGFRDSYDRLLAQREIALAAGQSEVPLEYTADEFSTNWMRAEALLLTGDREIELREASFSVPKRRHGRHNFVMWDAPLDPLGPYAWRQLQEVGFDVCLIGSMGGERPQPAALRACDASLAPYSTRILDPKDEHGFMQPVCWNDEPAVTAHVQAIVDNQRQLREQGVFVYSLGDEGVTQGCCVHPACLAAYREYLREQYGEIARLNASWGTAYGSFDEVDLLDHKDNMETASRQSCPPRWYDRQAFARHNLMGLSRRFVEAYRRLDPHALTGFEGTGGFGDDYDAILETNTFYGPYPSIGDDLVRSVAPRSTVRSNWMGYSKTGDALSDAAWRMVMKGTDSIWFWMWSGIGSWRGYLRPTFDLWPATADLSEEMRPVRQGLGDLLLRSAVAHSGIAVFYSVPSALAGQVSLPQGWPDPQADHEAWLRLTYELGCDVRYVTSAMLAAGALDTGEFRILVLPLSQAIGPEEAAAIRRFAEAGGTVVADVRPGVFDGHLKTASPGPLDDLFGIRRTPGAEPAAAEEAWISGPAAGPNLALTVPGIRPDPQVTADGAEALAHVGDVPIVLTREVGQGRAILLNFPPPLTDAEEVSASRDLLRWLYAVAGARAPIGVTTPEGRPLAMTETRVWRTGDALVFGLWRRMENAWFSPTTGTTAGEPVPAVVTLPHPMYVYDLRGKRALGRTDRIETGLRWGRASFFLATPEPLPTPEVAVSASGPVPGEPVTVRVGLQGHTAAGGTVALWAEVIDPVGASPLWGRRVVLLESGVQRWRIPTPHNAAPGRWRVRVTELFSGQSAEAAWNVR